PMDQNLLNEICLRQLELSGVHEGETVAVLSEGKTMGHAGAIVSGSAGTAQAKKEALEKVGVRVGKTPSETARLMREIMQAR
ncbi:MAG: succinate--CoA ligase subunit alpha, partial [Nonomuraea muscovyensis]|nr:succinate--CoA ligase subunit alpha [Nonomuraea muscovyensis]